MNQGAYTRGPFSQPHGSSYPQEVTHAHGGPTRIGQEQVRILPSYTQETTHAHGGPVKIETEYERMKKLLYSNTSSGPFSWKMFSSKVPKDAVFASPNAVVIQALYNNDIIIGKLDVNQMKCYIPYNGKEVRVRLDIAILTVAPGSFVEWIPAGHGQVPQLAVGPSGKDGLFVGRAICPGTQSEYVPGKVHPMHRALYMPWDGKEVISPTYEVCVITQGAGVSQGAGFGKAEWQKYAGKLPENAVLASKEYAIIRSMHGGEWVPGKFNTQTLRGYIAFDMKEHDVYDFEVLVQTKDSQACWIPAFNGQVPHGAVGPFSADGTFVGRAVCPYPENVYTPGKVHPAHGCMYMAYNGKEERYNNYEVLVMMSARDDFKSKFVKFFTGRGLDSK